MDSLEIDNILDKEEEKIYFDSVTDLPSPPLSLSSTIINLLSFLMFIPALYYQLLSFNAVGSGDYI